MNLRKLLIAGITASLMYLPACGKEQKPADKPLPNNDSTEQVEKQPKNLIEMIDFYGETKNLGESQRTVSFDWNNTAQLSPSVKVLEINYFPEKDDGTTFGFFQTLRLIYDKDAELGGVKGVITGLYEVEFQDYVNKEKHKQILLINDLGANGKFNKTEAGNPIDKGVMKEFKGSVENLTPNQFEWVAENIFPVLQNYFSQLKKGQEQKAKYDLFKELSDSVFRNIPA